MLVDAPNLGLAPWYYLNYSHPSAAGYSRAPPFLMYQYYKPLQVSTPEHMFKSWLAGCSNGCLWWPVKGRPSHWSMGTW